MNKSSNMWRIGWKYSGRKPNEGLRKCARCHFALGIGIKISARLLGCSTRLPAKVRKESGATGIRLKTGRAAYRPISPRSEVLVDHFKAGWMAIIDAERRVCVRHDALWSKIGGHAEFMRWYGREQARTQWANNRNDPHYRLAKSCRHRVWQKLGGDKRGKRTFELIGCSERQLNEHIESQFEPWMSWDNYGSEWHVDHIKPCAAFDLSVDSERLACFHYTNLRPLRALDNWRKSSRFNGVLFRNRAKIYPLALS